LEGVDEIEHGVVEIECEGEIKRVDETENVGVLEAFGVVGGRGVEIEKVGGG
jgi:hypothetical protein